MATRPSGTQRKKKSTNAKKPTSRRKTTPRAQSKTGSAKKKVATKKKATANTDLTGSHREKATGEETALSATVPVNKNNTSIAKKTNIRKKVSVKQKLAPKKRAAAKSSPPDSDSNKTTANESQPTTVVASNIKKETVTKRITATKNKATARSAALESSDDSASRATQQPPAQAAQDHFKQHAETTKNNQKTAESHSRDEARTSFAARPSTMETMTSAMNHWTDYWFSTANQTLDMTMRGADIGMHLIQSAANKAAEGETLDFGNLTSNIGQSMQLDPSAVFNANFRLLQKQSELWAYATEKALGNSADPVVAAEAGDKRFKSDAWSEELVFDVLKQNYLLLSSWMLDMVNNGTAQLDEKERARLAFMTKQIIDAMSPTNFAATNPDVLAKTVDSQGKNLSTGLSNLQRDLKNGSLNIRQVDPEAFSVGRDIAITEGSVVYENELIQLIQYSPLTEKVSEVPLLIVPPWINKFYILDLKPDNSFIRWSVEQGLTVFVVSWRNVDSSMRDTTFDDYMTKGIIDALSAIEKATGQRQVNAIGYCIGGTLLAATLAWMSARNDKRIRSATFFTTQVDFSEPGDLGHFIDEPQIRAIETMMQHEGYLDGAEMARTFNMLRSNDLIWSFWINNYLLGRDALDFDLLYWNADSTRIPQHTHSFYLRQMYLENNLVKPGGITLAGEPLHLDKVDIPVYLQATRDDHIAPWRSVIKAKQHFSGDVRFVLAGSGHIAGVVNPPHKQKYSHWLNDAEPTDPDTWDAGATETQGSWWPDWIEWVKPQSGQLVAARTPGDSELKKIEPAPGRYVLE